MFNIYTLYTLFFVWPPPPTPLPNLLPTPPIYAYFLFFHPPPTISTPPIYKIQEIGHPPLVIKPPPTIRQGRVTRRLKTPIIGT